MKPFIHLFKTPKNFYFYDVNRNENIKIEKEMYDYLENSIKSASHKKNMELEKRLELFKDKGYLSTNKVEEIEHPFSQLLDTQVNRQMEMLILQVTQNCNLRCSYCPYSSNDGTNRLHSNKNMTWELAKQSIDYYKSKTVDTGKVVLSFYGGEPLLEFKLIRKCVDYFKTTFIGKKLEFHMTTNATLIDNTIAKYLEKNNFKVTVSLDGTKFTNDRNRKFLNKTDSVFDVVTSNIQMIKKDYKKLYKDLNINMVMDQRLPYQIYLDMFEKIDYLKDIEIRMTTIDDTSLINKIEPSSKFSEQYLYYKFLTYIYLLGGIDLSKEKHILNHFIDECKESLDGLNRGTKLNKSSAPTGTCLIGKERLMVNVDGNIYPCERLSETIERNCIGKIDNGIEMNKAVDLLNIAKLNKYNCIECFAFRHCTLCPKAYDSLEHESMIQNCNICRMSFHEKLIGIEILNEIKDAEYKQ